MNKNYLYFLFILFLLFSCKQQNADIEKPIVKKGIIDISNFDFESQSSLDLDGDWAFYWKKLLKPENFNTFQKPDTFVEFPGLWTEFTVNKNKLTSYGYATYHLKVISNTDNEIFVLNVKEILTAYNLYVNGKLVASNGKVGTNKNEMLPEYCPKTVFVKLDSINDFVIQASNFYHTKGGVFNSISIGKNESFLTEKFKKIGFDLFLFGALFIMAIYHFALFILRRKDYSTLFFGIYALFIGLRTLITSQKFLMLLLPALSWEFAYKIEYFTVYISSPTCVIFFYLLFPKEINKKVVHIFSSISALFCLSVLFTNAGFYSMFMMYYQLIMLIIILYLSVSIVRSTIRKREGSLVLLIGALIFFIAIINEILFEMAVLHTFETLSFGLFIFIFSQSIVISMRFSKSFKRTEELTVELNYKNENLEKIVEQRTLEVQKQKHEIEVSYAELNQLNEEILAQRDNLFQLNQDLQQKNEEILTQNEEIEFQKNEIENKGQKIEIQHKKINNSILYARRIQQAILSNSKVLDNYFTENFIFFKPRDVVSGDFYYIKQIDNYILIAAADCTGHGVPGAFMSMLGVALLNEIVNHSIINNSSLVLNELRKQIKHSLQQTGAKGEQQDGMDIAFCSININNLEMSFAGAHNPCWIFRNNNTENTDNQNIYNNLEFLTIEADRMPVGIYIKEKDFSEKKFQFQKNDVFYIFSDGYNSQFGGENNMKYKTKRMKDFLKNICQKSMSEQSKLLENEFYIWKNKNDQTDDVLVIGITI